RPAAARAAGARRWRSRPSRPQSPRRQGAAAEGHARARARRHGHGRDAGRRRVGKNRAMTRWVGQAIPRREDLPLLTGRGQFVDDVPIANPLHVAFARSPWAHAEIRSINLSAALAAPGVAVALSGAELPDLTDPFAAGITHRLAYYAMAVDRARYA